MSKMLRRKVEDMNRLSEDLTNNDLEFFKYLYTPFYFVDVERSFSNYKNVLSNNHHRFTFEND